MKLKKIAYILAIVLTLCSAHIAFGNDCVPGRCVPDRPIPPESVGSIGVPFDLPVWPTIVKTEFHILPWLSFGKASICLPGCSKPIDVPAPCLSMKPIPVWFPWLRPLDVECKDKASTCRMP
jgi:hypothetical protein